MRDQEELAPRCDVRDVAVHRVLDDADVADRIRVVDVNLRTVSLEGKAQQAAFVAGRHRDGQRGAYDVTLGDDPHMAGLLGDVDASAVADSPREGDRAIEPRRDLHELDVGEREVGRRRRPRAARNGEGEAQGDERTPNSPAAHRRSVQVPGNR